MPSYVGNGQEEEIMPVDVKSMIAAFSQGPTVTISSNPARSPPIPRTSKPPILKKVSSTSQLLPAWQQQQQQKQKLESERHGNEQLRETSPSLLNPSQLPSNRPRASTSTNQDTIKQTPSAFNQDTLRQATNGESSNGHKLGVKSIIVLYGQLQTRESSDSRGPRSREASLDGDNIDTLRRAAVPPPALPPRPKSNSAQLSQSNTGSSANEESTAVATTTSPPSSYAPYQRKGMTGTATPNNNGSPALPPRFWGGASSTEDLSIDPSHSSLPTSTMRMGPKWASSSSGNLTLQGGEVGIPPPPAVPPRAAAAPSTTTTTSSSSPSSLALPPPKRVPQSPSTSTQIKKSPVSSAQIKKSLIASSSSPAIPIPVSSSATASINNTSRSIPKSSLPPKSTNNNNSSSSSTVIAPPPRHVNTHRLGTISHVSTSSTSSLRSISRRKNRRRMHRAETVYSRDPGEAEQRYILLFDRLLKEQQNKMAVIIHGQLLNKRTVVRLWKQSRLEDIFLAKVWDAAIQVDGHGIGKVSFTRAMSAIDFELAHRQTEREARSRT